MRTQETLRLERKLSGQHHADSSLRRLFIEHHRPAAQLRPH
jgi:hypothetical protein